MNSLEYDSISVPPVLPKEKNCVSINSDALITDICNHLANPHTRIDYKYNFETKKIKKLNKPYDYNSITNCEISMSNNNFNDKKQTIVIPRGKNKNLIITLYRIEKDLYKIQNYLITLFPAVNTEAKPHLQRSYVKLENLKNVKKALKNANFQDDNLIISIFEVNCKPKIKKYQKFIKDMEGTKKKLEENIIENEKNLEDKRNNFEKVSKYFNDNYDTYEALLRIHGAKASIMSSETILNELKNQLAEVEINIKTFTEKKDKNSRSLAANPYAHKAKDVG